MNDPVTITMSMDDLQAMARRGELLVRSFGECHVLGFDRVFNGNFDRAADHLPRLVDEGLIRVYADKDRVFVGPSAVALVGMSVDLVNDLDGAGIDYETLRAAMFRLSLENSGLVITQLLGAVKAEDPTPDQKALMAVFGPKGDDRS
jgi:hypothetical protein